MEEANREHHRNNNNHSDLRLQQDEVREGPDCHEHTTNHIPPPASNAVGDGTVGWHHHKTEEGCNDETGVHEAGAQLQRLHTIREDKGSEEIEGGLFSRPQQGRQDNLAPVVAEYFKHRNVGDPSLLFYPPERGSLQDAQTDVKTNENQQDTQEEGDTPSDTLEGGAREDRLKS